jgi:RNA polymerase sigma-70 factor (ECF subfamily)
MDQAKERFLQAYMLNADAIFRFCFFRLSDRELAKETAQEAFMRTWQYLVGGGQIHNLRAFLYKAASNLVIDQYRKRRPQDSLEALQEASGFEPAAKPGVDWINRLDGAEAIALLKQLPEPYGQALYLRYVDELSLAEIAKIVQQNENTIAVRIHRGLAKLKKLLDHEQS